MNLASRPRHVARRVLSRTRRRVDKPRRLSFDCLEDRRLLSLSTPGTSLTIDSSGSLQYDSPRAVAMDSAGDAVVA